MRRQEMPAEDARKYVRRVFKHFGVKRAKFANDTIEVELEDGSHGLMTREQQSTTWETVAIGKAHRAKWKWFVENWLWSLKAGDTLGVDMHLSEEFSGDGGPDIVYKPVIRPLASRDLDSLKIELDLLKEPKSRQHGQRDL